MATAKFAPLLILVSFAFCQELKKGDDQKLRDELQRNPRNSLAHLRLGEALFQQHNFQAAANELRAALNSDGHPQWIDLWAHIDLGEIFELTNQPDRAAREYDSAMRIADDPGDAKAIAKGISTPKPLVKVPARYSREGRIAELEGSVQIAAAIKADGSVSKLGVTGPLGAGLDDEATAAAARWTFQPGRTEDGPTNMTTTLELNFLLPAKTSRWHLLRASFDNPDGTSRPRFIKTIYPEGYGVSSAIVDDARLIAAIGRQALVTLQFDVDSSGRPTAFRIKEATGLGWGQQAISFVRNWRFLPGDKNGGLVSVPCTINLVWGEKRFTEESLAQARGAFLAIGTPQ